MAGISLHFKGPYFISDLFDVNHSEITMLSKLKLIENFKTKIDSQGIDMPGIYIWGFNYPDINIFTPYYVGQILDSVASRIKSHINEIIVFHSKKYRRLSPEYMKSFYKDPTYPLYIERNYKLAVREKLKSTHPEYSMDDKDWFDKSEADFHQKVAYYNSKKFKNTQKFIENRQDQDILYNLIKEGKFAFYFSNIEINGKVQKKGELNDDQMNIFEAYTKFNLNGRTSSMSISWEEVEKRLVKFKNLSPDDIVVKNNAFKNQYFKALPIDAYVI